MKPAPAISARETSALAGSAAMISAASSRGLRPAALASRSATFDAKSPCLASRVRSTTIAAGSVGGRRPLSPSWVRAAASSFSSSVFKRPF
jgi:hypothetical protein